MPAVVLRVSSASVDVGGDRIAEMGDDAGFSCESGADHNSSGYRAFVLAPVKRSGIFFRCTFIVIINTNREYISCMFWSY